MAAHGPPLGFRTTRAVRETATPEGRSIDSTAFEIHIGKGIEDVTVNAWVGVPRTMILTSCKDLTDG